MTARKHAGRGRGGQQGHEPRARIRTRETRAVELSIQGWSQAQIALDLGVSQAAVCKILQRVDARVVREMTNEGARQKARHTVRLEYVYGQSMRAWEASKKGSTRRRQRKSQASASGDGATVAEIVVDEGHGDPRYLREAREALADLRKLWGVDAPHTIDLRAQRSPYDGMSEDALRVELRRQQGLMPPEPIAPAEHTSGVGPEEANADAPRS